MLNKFPRLLNLSQWIGGRQAPSEAPAIDIWVYAEPAGEEPDPRQRNVLQWRRLITAVPDPIFSFAGQPVDVVGFVHRPRDLPLSASPRPEWRGRSAVAGSGHRCVGSRAAAD